MTFLAHWKFGDGWWTEPTIAADSAAGGSGSHDGTYTWGYWGGLVPGGVGGTHIYKPGATAFCNVSSIANPSDFLLYGALTVCCWYHPDHYYNYHNPTYLVNCSGVDDTAPENDLWSLQIASDRRLLLHWENGAGVDVFAASNNYLFPLQGWSHATAERYEVVAGKWGCNFYRNGALHSTDDNGGAGYDPPDGGANALPRINHRGTTNSYRSYDMDSVRVYDTAIGAAAIQAIYDEEEPFFNSVPVKSDWSPSDFVRYSLGQVGARYKGVHSGPNSGRENAGFFRW